MKQLRNILCVFLLITVLFSCKKENRCDCFKRTGEIITVTRSVNAFDRLQVEQNVNVFITDAAVQEVKVEAGKNIEPLIETVVQDGILIIRNHNRCNWARSYDKPLNVYIKTPGLKYITSDGTGKISSQNTIVKDTFDIRIMNSGNIELTVNSGKVISHIFGAGDLTLHGRTAEHACSIGGASFLHAEDLDTDYTWIQSYTTGNSYVFARNLFICRIDDLGDIHCTGHPPNVTKTFNGKGNLYFD
ncbi:MAG: head GIN domain-containing protein [Bacteroidia bacterium]